MSKIFTPADLQQLVKIRQGSEAIYVEKTIVAHVKLVVVEATKEWVRLKIRDMNTAGFIGPVHMDKPEPIWNAGSSWDYFGYLPERWSAAYGGWTIYFDNQLIDSLCEFAQSIVEADGRARYQILGKHLQSMLTSKT